MDDASVLQAALAFHRRDGGVALVTLINRQGSSPRPLGSQMAVSAEGECVGSLTGTGCAEQLIIHEAQAALTAGENRILRLGEGSPYIDIRLPCGAGIDLHIDTQIDADVLAELVRAHEARHPAALETDRDKGIQRCTACLSDKPLASRSFRRWLYPPLRLVVIGQGDIAIALSCIAIASGYAVDMISPDQATLLSAGEAGAQTTRLPTANLFCAPMLDAWTAAVTLFHDHEWELPILNTLLNSPCFYLGALGSRSTHAQRLSALHDLGWINAGRRLHGPVGLDIGAQTPNEIALSILAEITQSFRATERPLLEIGPDFVLNTQTTTCW
ncbi:XdhC family protein [Marinobacter bohaiensis]|uniref:XdhC family protein n=1 Tax=Marinobacter bohaiensis TaxID=2201898 RepID=UPI000DADE4BA|nr:XdhC family protein [Marinobacter bohaiensis]